MFTGGTDAKVEFPVLWPTDAKNRLTEKKKMLMLGNTEGRRRGGHKRQDGWMASTTQ